MNHRLCKYKKDGMKRRLVERNTEKEKNWEWQKDGKKIRQNEGCQKKVRERKSRLT